MSEHVIMFDAGTEGEVRCFTVDGFRREAAVRLSNDPDRWLLFSDWDVAEKVRREFVARRFVCPSGSVPLERALGKQAGNFRVVAEASPGMQLEYDSGTDRLEIWSKDWSGDAVLVEPGDNPAGNWRVLRNPETRRPVGLRVDEWWARSGAGGMYPPQDPMWMSRSAAPWTGFFQSLCQAWKPDGGGS